jgi:hypothetical protein
MDLSIRLDMARGTQVLKMRVEEALREIGVLLITFAPLDAALVWDTPGHRTGPLIFLAIGVIVFAVSVYLESRREHV